MLQHVAQTGKVAESVAEWCGAGLGHVTYGICWGLASFELLFYFFSSS